MWRVKEAESHRVKHSLALSLLFYAPWIATAQTLVTGAEPSRLVEYASHPKYPDVARWLGFGSGF
jgi:hypothetical protein